MKEQQGASIHNAFSMLTSTKESLEIVQDMCKQVDINTPTQGLAFQDGVHGVLENVIGYLDSGLEGISSAFPDVGEEDPEDPEEPSGDLEALLENPVLGAVSTRKRTLEEIVNGSFYKLGAFLEMADRWVDPGLHAGTVPVAQVLLEKAKKDVMEALSGNGKAPDIVPSQGVEPGASQIDIESTQ